MINKIKITCLSKAEKYSFSNDNDYNVWISVVGQQDRKEISRMSRNFAGKNVKFFHQFFADWSDEDGIQWKHLEHEAPQKRHIQNIITFLRDFVQDEKAHTLGVNCFAGISRSTAIGIIALVMSGRVVEQALTEILRVRPEAWPNLRILGFGSEILGIDIKTYVAEWKKRCNLEGDLWVPNRMQPHEIQ
jgi:predicted protein tyrosine phosphatase